MFDEMALETAVSYNKNHDKIDGLVELTTKQCEFADHALTFMVRGAVSKWQQPIAFYFSKGTASGVEMLKILRLIVEAVVETGLIPLALVCDQGASFRSAIKMLQQETRELQIKSGLNTGEFNN